MVFISPIRYDEIMKVLVTGAMGGLGSQLCKYLLDAHCEVVGIYRKTDSIEEKLIAENPRFKGIELDFTNVTAADKCADIAKNDIDHVVFCHGMNVNKDILTLERSDLIFSLQVNFIATFLIAQQVLARWKEKSSENDRSLTYISSVATKCANPDELAYHSAKRSMEGAMLSFAYKFAKYNIRANVISPGLMDTKMGHETLKKRPDALKRLLLKKMVSVDEVVILIDTLMHSQSITGQNIHINNGRYTNI